MIFRLKQLIALVAIAEISMVNLAQGADEKVFIFWDTVSPNGKYALAWTKAGSVEPDDMPYPDDPEGGVKDWLLEVPSRKPAVLLPDATYWRLADYRPNHYDLETVWSDDSSRLLVLLDSRYSTDQVLLVDPREGRVHDFAKSMQRGFYQVLRRNGGAAHGENIDSYYMTFSYPWFTGRDMIEVVGDATIHLKSSDFQDFEYHLTFGIGSGSFSLQKAAALTDVSEESSDRQLNRVYRTLIGLLSPSEREALIQEERTWIAKRDATNGSKAKEDLTKARTEELTKRKDDRISSLEDEEQKLKTGLTTDPS
jgi:hypothetical protein